MGGVTPRECGGSGRRSHGRPVVIALRRCFERFERVVRPPGDPSLVRRRWAAFGKSPAAVSGSPVGRASSWAGLSGAALSGVGSSGSGQVSGSGPGGPPQTGRSAPDSGGGQSGVGQSGAGSSGSGQVRDGQARDGQVCGNGTGFFRKYQIGPSLLILGL